MSGENNRNDHRPRRFWPSVIDAIRNYSEYYRKQNEKPDDPLSHRIGFWTRCTAIATWAAAVLAGVAAYVFWCQLGAMQGQLDETRDEQRPWVEMVATPADSVPGDMGAIPLNIVVKNVGHQPAFNVRPEIFSYVLGTGHNNSQAYQRERCDYVRKQRLDNPSRGMVLFPGEEKPVAAAGGFIAAGWDPESVRKYSRVEGGHRVVILDVVGCVDYMFGVPPRHHQTGYVYQLEILSSQPNGQVVSSFSIPIDEQIPGASLKLLDSPSSSVGAD